MGARFFHSDSNYSDMLLLREVVKHQQVLPSSIPATTPKAEAERR